MSGDRYEVRDGQWHVKVVTDAHEYEWQFQASTPKEFRETLNRLGRQYAVSYSAVRVVTFTRTA
jgi:hypothetical protein